MTSKTRKQPRGKVAAPPSPKQQASTPADQPQQRGKGAPAAEDRVKKTAPNARDRAGIAQRRYPTSLPNREALYLLLPALVVIVCLVFGRIVGHDFVLWDDTITIFQNPYLNPVSWDHLAYFWQHPYEKLYIPLSYSVFSFLASVAHLPHLDPSITDSGALLNPHLFHGASLVMHAVNVVLVFLILRLLVRRDLPAAAGALLFALHPVQVESVAWASELRGLLAGFFSLLAVWWYLRFSIGAKQRRRHSNGAYVLYGGAMLAGVLALLCKPSAVTLPLILLVLDVWCVGRSWRQSVQSAGALVLVAIPFLLITQSAQPVEAKLHTALWTRPFVAGDALAFYLAKLVAPLNLAIDYGRTPQYVMGQWWGYLTWLFPAGLAFGLWAVRKRYPWLIAAGLISLVTVLPVLGLVPFAFQHYSTVADRYLYVALLGPALGVAYVLAEHGRRLLVVSGLLLLPLGIMSVVQAGYWSSNFTLLPHELAVNPNSDVTYNNLAIALARHGKLDEAMTRLHTALQMNPDNYMAYSNMGNVYLLRNKVPQAITEYQQSIRVNASWAESRDNLGIALAIQHNYQAAIDQFRQALQIDPTYSKAQTHLAQAQALLKRQH